MLKRKIYKKLLDWKEKENKSALLIKGARQIGKTYIVREFGKKEYKSFIELNFLTNPEYKTIFDGSLSGAEIMKKISGNISNAQIITNDTLLFLDEIQMCPNARTALKFLVEYKKIDVIASGSLLGLSYGEDTANKKVGEIPSIPVGYEEQIIMYSMDFEEFLWALGYSSEVISYLKEYYDEKEKVDIGINNKYEQFIREFIVVGGMPEAVSSFVVNKDFNEVDKIQNKILSSYDDDIIHHAPLVEKIKVKNCLDSIPNQLAKENKKFKYSEIEKGSSARKYSNSIYWLVHANLVNICSKIMNPFVPLKYNKVDNEFKVYLHDIGLLMAMYGKETKSRILNNTLIGNIKGGIYENLIASELIKKSFDLFYFKPNDDNEIEFLIETGKGVIPIEVKSGNTATVSLNRYIEKYKPFIAYKYANTNIGYINTKLTLPHYMIMFIEDYFE